MDSTAGIFNSIKNFGANTVNGIGHFLGKTWTWITMTAGKIFNKENVFWLKDLFLALIQKVYNLGEDVIRFLQTRAGVVGMLSVSSAGCAIAAIFSDNVRVRLVTVPLALGTAVGAVFAGIYMD